MAVPDLSALVRGLTSADPDQQEAMLAPALRLGDSDEPGVLPPGSTLVLQNNTWQVVDTDGSGAPAEAVITGTVVPSVSIPPQPLTLHLVNVDGQWLLAETVPE
jgi:hypothetical protein